MKAMQLDSVGAPLRLMKRETPRPGPAELLVEIAACGVCRTDLHVIDGDLRGPLPIVPGHEIVGRVAELGERAGGFAIGDRIGVPWLGRTCGACPYCRSGRENLCDAPVFTGFTRDGGFATHCVADARFCLPIPEAFGDVEAAPLLCAGLIGYRSLFMAGEGEAIGLYGFGAAAHIIAQVAAWQGRRVHAFTKSGDAAGQAFARSLGCVWAGASDEAPPEPLDAAILSVANLTREDGVAFMSLAAEVPVRTHTTAFPLAAANEAVELVRAGRIDGAAVLVPWAPHI